MSRRTGRDSRTALWAGVVAAWAAACGGGGDRGEELRPDVPVVLIDPAYPDESEDGSPELPRELPGDEFGVPGHDLDGGANEIDAFEVGGDDGDTVEEPGGPDTPAASDIVDDTDLSVPEDGFHEAGGDHTPPAEDLGGADLGGPEDAKDGFVDPGPGGCGDGECLGDEDCEDCPEDCGECPPTLWFRSDWAETLDGPIVAGGRLRVRYDLDRLTQCRQTHNGLPAWTITLFYTDDLAKPPREVQVVSHGPDGQTWPIEPVIDVPGQARDLWFWAKNTGIEGCVAWDSNYGQNYQMPVFLAEEVSKPVEWVGWREHGLDFAYVNEWGVVVSKGDVDPVWYFDSLGGAEVTTEVRIQVYAAGITDRLYQNEAVTAEVAHTAISMAAETDFAQGAGWPGAPVVLVPLEFEFQASNNFFYRWLFGAFGYVWSITPSGPPPPGLYSFRLAARTHNGPVTWVGKPGAPASARGLVYAPNPDLGCPIFPGDPPPDLCPGR